MNSNHFVMYQVGSFQCRLIISFGSVIVFFASKISSRYLEKIGWYIFHALMVSFEMIPLFNRKRVNVQQNANRKLHRELEMSMENKNQNANPYVSISNANSCFLIFIWFHFIIFYYILCKKLKH